MQLRETGWSRRLGRAYERLANTPAGLSVVTCTVMVLKRSVEDIGSSA
jgi:hypothetical protein